MQGLSLWCDLNLMCCDSDEERCRLKYKKFFNSQNHNQTLRGATKILFLYLTNRTNLSRFFFTIWHLFYCCSNAQHRITSSDERHSVATKFSWRLIWENSVWQTFIISFRKSINNSNPPNFERTSERKWKRKTREKQTRRYEREKRARKIQKYLWIYAQCQCSSVIMLCKWGKLQKTNCWYLNQISQWYLIYYW